MSAVACINLGLELCTQSIATSLMEHKQIREKQITSKLNFNVVFLFWEDNLYTLYYLTCPCIST